MIPQLAKSKDQPFSPFSAPAPLHLYSHRLTDADRSEVLGFLKERPLHTAIMSGFIRDNGIQNPLNRGTFHACRNEDGHLEGVALIGHAMFLDPRTDEALRLFAQLAQECKTTHMIMGEQQVIQRFWNYYCARGQRARLFSRELLLELTLPVKVLTPVPNLRRATVDDLALVTPVHAALACGESGVNPLDIDPDGFRLRCRRRIERGRVWILVENGRLIFKADVISDLPEVNYVEGVYVDPAERRRGIASRCVTQMSFALSSRTKAISVLVNEEYGAALSFFQRVGFVPRAQYDTIFLDEKN